MKDRLLLQLMKWMPTHAISRMVGHFASHRISKVLIPFFAKYYKICLEEAERDIKEYTSLNEFFTRKLQKGYRPIASDSEAVVSPADGVIAAYGTIQEGMLLQAKGVYYSVWNLLGIAQAEAERYNGGSYITIYLSPRDYHRIHSPIEGDITDYRYIPGTLFPVNAFGVRAVRGLFAMNERLITFISSQFGQVGIVKVGATMVGSVKVGYSADAGTNGRIGKIVHQKLPHPIHIGRGEELGFFEFGSTVILVFEKGKIEFKEDLKEGKAVKMGEKIARSAVVE